VFWDTRLFAGSDGADLFYDVPHHREISRGSWQGSSGYHPHGTGPWRAPATNTNSFARESQIDIMASRAGRDPLEYRLHHLTDKKMRRVLEAERRSSAGPRPKRRAQGCGWRAESAPGPTCHLCRGGGGQGIREVQVKAVAARSRHGAGHQPSGREDAGRGLPHHGPRYALKKKFIQERQDIGPKTLTPTRSPLFLGAKNRNGAHRKRFPSSRRRGAGHRVCGRCDRQCHLRCRGARWFIFP